MAKFKVMMYDQPSWKGGNKSDTKYLIIIIIIMPVVYLPRLKVVFAESTLFQRRPHNLIFPLDSS